MNLISLVFFFIAALIFSEALVGYYSSGKKLSNYDVILVLGANGDPKSAVVRDRALNALEAHSQWPKARIILTGNGERKETEAFVEVWRESGSNIPPYEAETASRDTWDNFLNSSKMWPPESRVLVVTSEYHQRRALAIAHAIGINADAYGNDRNRYNDRVYFFFKERISALKWVVVFFKIKFAGLFS